MANYCTKCGNKLTPDNRFCPECGSPVSEDNNDFGITQSAEGDLTSDIHKESGRLISGSETVKNGKGKNKRLKSDVSVKKEKKESKGLFKKILIGYLALTVGYMGFINPGYLLPSKKEPGQSSSGNSGTSESSEHSGKGNTYKDSLGLVLTDTGELSPNADNVTLKVSDCLVHGGGEYFVDPYDVIEDSSNHIKVYTYDIYSPQITGELNGYLEIRIPYDDTHFSKGEDPARCLGVYVVDDDGNMEPELFEVDTENKEVVIYSTHLSKRQVYHYPDAPTAEKYEVNVGNTLAGNLSFKDCADVMLGFINNMDEMDAAEKDFYLHKGAIDVLLKAGYGVSLRIFPKEMNNYINDASGWITNAATIAALGGEYTQSYISSGIGALSKLGLYTSMCKFSYALSDLDSPWRAGSPSKEEVLNMYKTSLTSGLDYIGTYYQTGWIASQYAMSMSGVFVFGLLIDSMFEEAMYTKMENMAAVYEYFGDTYTEGDYRPRNNQEWYDLFMDIFERYYAAGKQDYIEEAIEREIYIYATRFWELTPEEVGNITDAAGYRRMPYPTEKEIEKMTETYEENLKYRLHPIVLQCERTMAKRAEERVQEWYRKAYDIINNKVSMELKDGHEKVQYGNYYFRFDNLADTADKTIWQGQLNKDGKFTASFSLNDWINAGVPVSVSLYATEQDMIDDKNAVAAGKFIPAKNASDITTVIFEEIKDGFELKVTRNGVTAKIKVEGAIAYRETDAGIGDILCQAKKDAVIKITLTESDGSTWDAMSIGKEMSYTADNASGTTLQFDMRNCDSKYNLYMIELRDKADELTLLKDRYALLNFYAVDDYTETNLGSYEPNWSETKQN